MTIKPNDIREIDLDHIPLSGDIPENVFVAVYCKHPVYENYGHVPEEDKGMIVPLVLMIERWDGVKGFIGGMVDEGYSLYQTAIKEMKEEAGYELTDGEILSSQILSSHTMQRKNGTFQKTHLIGVEVNIDTLKNIIKSSATAEHFLSEVAGMNAIHFINYKNKNSFNNFIAGSFAPTVKEEIADMITTLGWGDEFNLNTDFVPREHLQISLQDNPSIKM